MDLILKGIVTGFILSIMVGPAFFVLLETSIRKGVRSAIAFDIGIFMSDIFYILLALFFYNQVYELTQSDNNSVLRLVGGSLFCGYGTYSFFKKSTEIKIDSKIDMSNNKKGYLLLALKGFALNMVNPMVIFYWFSVLTLGAEDSSTESANYSMLFFITTILLTFFSFDILKILGAKRLRPLVTASVLRKLNRVIGMVFWIFGVVLVAQGIIGLK